MNLSQYIGREVIYIESSEVCLATLIDIQYNSEEVTAIFETPQKTYPSCTVRGIVMSNEDEVLSWSNEQPFGKRWEIMSSLREFFADGSHWQVSFLYGAGGIRMFFHPEFIEAFKHGEIDWLSKFYNGED